MKTTISTLEELNEINIEKRNKFLFTLIGCEKRSIASSRSSSNSTDPFKEDVELYC